MNIFDDIARRALDGQRLSEHDAMALFQHPNLMELGDLANRVNLRRNGPTVFYNINRHINPTNICAMSCKFCAYSKKPGEEGGYTYSIAEILHRAAAVVAEGATEIHMVGGLHPRWRLKNYTDIVSALHTTYPQIHIKAFTAVEIDWLARRERMTHREVLSALREAGLGSMPGGGAEIFHPEIREAICDTKTDAEQWLNIHRTAHELGMRSNCTMLYGHIERLEHRVDHMARLRKLQDETKSFNVFIPLAFQPHDNQMGIDRYTAGTDDLRTIAVARLFLDNFKHIKAYWIMLGQDIAQIALHFGANDLDGTVTEEKISRAAGGRAGIVMSRNEIEALIRKCGRIPVERDTLYHPVSRPSVTTTDSATVIDGLTDACAAILNKVHLGVSLNYDEGLTLLQQAPLSALAAAAQHVRERQTLDAAATLGIGIQAPALSTAASVAAAMQGLVTELDGLEANDLRRSYGVIVDLGSSANQSADLEAVCQFAEQINSRYGRARVVVRGSKGMWRMARKMGLSLSESFAQLAAAGVAIFESSPLESEADLTTDEIFETHRAAYAADMQTVAKLEISAPVRGHQQPFWDAFLNRLFALRELQTTAMGLKAVSLEPAPDSFVSAVEYLRGLAIARIVLENVGRVIAPFSAIPTMRTPIEGARAADLPMLKVAPLCLEMGASDLGLLLLKQDQPQVVAEELRASGIASQWRDARFETVTQLT